MRMGGSRGRATEILQRRIESCKNRNFISIEELVDHLCSNYPDYSRMKVRVLTTCVKKSLEEQRKRNQSSPVSKAINVEGDSDEEEEEEEEDTDPSTTTTTPSQISDSKKLKENDEKEAGDLRTSPSTSASSASVEATGDAKFETKVGPPIDTSKIGLKVEKIKAHKRGLMEKIKSSEKEGNELKGNGDSSEKVKDGPRFKDLGGIKGILDELNMEVLAPLYHPELPLWLGVKPMSGILLHGPPGCGKTKLAHAIANETGVPFYKISATEVVSGVSGASEENIRDLFSKAYRTAPSIVFIDEIDAIASKRENLQREMERRIVTQLLTCMDDTYHNIDSENVDLGSKTCDLKPGYVLVIGATNRPHALDPALRRPGRFDREIALGVPDEKARAEILSVLACKLRLENGGAFDIGKIARATAGFVGADLEAMVNKAGNLAMRRIFNSRKSNNGVHNEDWLTRPWLPEEMDGLSINMTDFEEAVTMVQPSSRREGFSTIPNVKWEDVGGLDFLRKEFDRYIVSRIKDPQDYEEFGVDMETGFLLYGPPGCGKTLIAKAVANEAGANFIHIKGPELMNKYVGESELAVRTIFSRARTCSPCVLFFDEVDAIAMKRGREGAWVVERLFTQLLIELDGADQRRGVFVIGATNRPQVMDEAIIRPGRLGKLLYVPLPESDQRGSILKALARKKPICPDVDLFAIGRKEACENLSGADLAAVMNEAAMVALEEKRMSGHESSDMKTWTIKETHFDQALDKITPSVSTKQRRFYDNLSKELRGMMRTTVEPNARVSYQDVIVPPLSG